MTLTAKRTGLLKSGYEISLAGRALVRWDAKTWKVGGSFTLDDQRYDVRTNALATKYELLDQDGASVAVAHRVGRKQWTVEADGQTYTFERGSMWREEQKLTLGGQQVGTIRRTSVWSGAAAADLPGLPLLVQVFVLLVALSSWDVTAAVAASA
ncbi:hypothetical protein [Cryptosporangium sp. NPDC048952]|uniref:hypothetical protein n=1 Tax=Cryptosporangium sp. NPDC048952 TaxID=3363961 RepID=UPI003720B187